ncbi:hypothetical protein QR680_009666 [Steinernema hermaphroditum]|uniref:VWFD domain-containing protein n=1 Tax=Steinernema hermaphroditum TaxID=289476 RepID=A0AA39IN66_9BILA|nr:hypothetical protein QR680_009666 [Steinernema hermaphroditum]
MSLFRVQEWYSTEVEGASSVAVVQLFGCRDQIVIGSPSGSVAILDPGGKVEGRQEMGLLMEQSFAEPVIGVCVGSFIKNLDVPTIAVLHPRSIRFCRLKSENNDSHRLDSMFEHKLPFVAYNMCHGTFGRSANDQVCVQSLNCALAIYEAEHHVFTRTVVNAMHPGPLAYSPQGELIVIASGHTLSLIKFQALAVASNTGQGKKLSVDWAFELGDTAVDIAILSEAAHPAIAVLCRRTVFCFSPLGRMYFMFRMETVAVSFLLYHSSSDPRIQMCISTSTQTLLFYSFNQTATHPNAPLRLAWSSQVDFVVSRIAMCSFSNSLRCLLGLLSPEGKLSIVYLGTEPSLYRFPDTETRYIDFQAKRKELGELEKMIRKAAKNSKEFERNIKFKIYHSVHPLDSQSGAYDSLESVPSLTVDVEVEAAMGKQIFLDFSSHLFSQETHFALENTERMITVTLFVKERPVRDLRCTITATTSAAESCMLEFKVPLALTCRLVASIRSALIKLTISSTESCIDLGKLYPEFDVNNQSSIGFQPYCARPDAVVSVFTAAKSNRYRIQSDRFDHLFMIVDDLVERIRQFQPNSRFECVVPFDSVMVGVERFAELEERRLKMIETVQKSSVQMRHIESVFLTRLKDVDVSSPTVDDDFIGNRLLTQYAYNDVLSLLDELAELDARLDDEAATLGAVFNLARAALAIDGKAQLPVGASIAENFRQQKVSDQLSWALSVVKLSGTAKEGFSRISESSQLKRQLETLFESGGALHPIVEEEDDELEAEAEKAADFLANRGFEFVRLETGSLVPSAGPRNSDLEVRLLGDTKTCGRFFGSCASSFEEIRCRRRRSSACNTIPRRLLSRILGSAPRLPQRGGSASASGDATTRRWRQSPLCDCRMSSSRRPPEDPFRILLLVPLLLLLLHGSVAQLLGKDVVCDNEGEKVTLPETLFDPLNPACFDCRCQKGEVACKRKTCPSLQTCPLAEPPRPGECCPSCLTCNYLGIERQNDERWLSSQDSCTTLTCKAGIITSARMQCVEECKHGVRIPGFCCKLCSTHRRAPLQLKNRDPCIVCDQRRDRWEHCYRIGCPVLDCPTTLHHQVEGRCCPECVLKAADRPRYATPIGPTANGTRHELVMRPRYRGVIGGYCTFRNRRYPVFASFRVDSCTRCKCEEGGIICQRFTCPPLDCDPSRIFFLEHVCCPFCHQHLPQPCTEVLGSRNATHKHGTLWRRDECTQCSCSNGTIACEAETCPETSRHRCPRGYKKVRPRGRCCYVCELREATCTVFGDPHYRTFDGATFSHQGLCSYILAQECTLRGQTPQFTVVSHNGNDDADYVWTKRISILIVSEYGDPFRVQLYRDKAIREQGELVAVPHTRTLGFPEYRAELDRGGNLVVTFHVLGFSVLWDGQSMVEVTASVAHRAHLCGLCGNFNNYTEDDMIPRYGAAPTRDVAKFAESWRWGDRCAASKWRKKKVFRCENPAVRREDLTACKTLRTSMLFVGCRPEIPVHGYIRKCLENVCDDSCDRESTGQPCFCGTFIDYALLCNDSDLLNLPIALKIKDLEVHPSCPRIKLSSP